MTTAEKLDRSLFENSDPCDPEFWRRAWRRAREASFLKCSQVASPQAWHDFYARVSDSYWELWGQDGEQGQRLVAEMTRQGLLRPGCHVLDVGCGPGTMALPLAQTGAMVTALDWCRPMLDNLERLAGQRGLTGITTRCHSWDDFSGDPKHDLVLAAFFPDALSVQGLERLEDWSRGRVVLVLGTGREHFAFRRQMWQQILEVPYHDGGFHLACDATNGGAVARLRQRKQREEKPFAVMVANGASLAPYATADEDELRLLGSRESPVVLVRKKPGCDLRLPGVAPGIAWLGVMLPYTPLQLLLFHEAAGRPEGTGWLAELQPLVLVMTSANPGGEPIVRDDAEALKRLTT
jgi:SAM-dependent methyltransferase